MMKRATCWISLTACAVTSLPAAAAKPLTPTDCGLKRYASVDLSVTPESVRVPVTIGDEIVWMDLNTQASMTVMWHSAAISRRLAIKDIPGRETVKFGGKQLTEYAVMHSFGLGGLRFQKAEFLLVPESNKMAQDGAVQPTIGALGMDVLATMDFEIDFRNRKLNLYSQDHCPGRAVYWAQAYASAPIRRGPLGNVFLPFELDGKKIQATLSTGAQRTTLPTDLTKRMYGFDEHSPGIETEMDASGQVKSQYRAMAITAPGLTLNNALVRLLPRRSSCGLAVSTGPDHAAQYTDCMGDEAPLHIGLDVLEKLHLYFATKENVLYFTAADAGFGAADTKSSSPAGVPGTSTAQ